MISKRKLMRALCKQVYWNTTASFGKKGVRKTIEKWLLKNPRCIDVYVKNPEYYFKRCVGAMEGRKEDLRRERHGL